MSEAKSLQLAARNLGDRISQALKPVIPSDITLHLTILAKDGNFRVEFQSLYRSSGWKDGSGNKRMI